MFQNLIASAPIIFRSQSTYIYHNLAFENFLFQHMIINAPIMFLWANERNIVIGRHQNPWKECYLDKMQEDGVSLSRRKSGGGAVYQDLGNHCFTFINPITSQEDPKNINNDILINALKEYNIDPILAGRNDIHLQGKKISGSAYQLSLETRKNPHRLSLHHGTMLLSCNFNDVPKYLNPSKKKLISKGVDSVVQRIINLNEVISHVNRDNWEDNLIKHFKKKYNIKELDIINVSDQNILENQIMSQSIKELTSWEWLYQYTPPFTNQIEEKFTWGLVDIYFDVQNGVVQNGKVFSDCLFPEFIQVINDILASGNIRYDFNGMKHFCDQIKHKFPHTPQYHEYISELQNCLIKQI